VQYANDDEYINTAIAFPEGISILSRIQITLLLRILKTPTTTSTILLQIALMQLSIPLQIFFSVLQI
jgi:hypothetical protein